MKRLLCLSLLSVLLAACTTPSQIPPETAPGGVPPAAEGPLVVPPLSALSDTPPRALAGRYQRSCAIAKA
ncbi:membrane-bound transglycosylase [Bordetella pertussis]|nr:membrane-bound transglycosylase [Bordetella pertussis]